MRLLRRITRLFRFREHDADLAEELSFHREAIERDLIARGHSPADARAAARRAMGNETFMREESRGVWLWPRLEAVVQDAKLAVRGLARSPGFTAGVMLTFALGVGANAAMFSLVDRLMFRPPAFMRDPAHVHRVYLYKIMNGEERSTGGQYARHADLARWTSSFSDVAGFAERQLAVGIGQDAREMPIGVVTASFFAFFDAAPAAGRYFTSAEDSLPMGTPVAVLSYAMWQARYGGQRDALGKKLQIGPLVYRIIGVTPDGFTGLWPLRPPAAFIPVATHAASGGAADWATTYNTAIGLGTMVRRKPDVSIAAASTDLTNAFVRSYRAQANDDPRYEAISTVRPRAVAGSVLLERGPEASAVARIATWLGGVTLIVLLIACANVANLLLARALARRREIAVRIALGVSRLRLLSQLLTESMLLSFLGSLAGIFVAAWMSTMLSATLFPGTERAAVLTDTRTLVFIGIITLGVGAFTGLLPMVQGGRLTITEDLKSGARAGTYQRSRARITLLVLQGALSLVLLVGAGLFVRSMQHVRDVRIGFDADSVLVVELNMRDVKLDSAQAVALRARLFAAAAGMPGVEHLSYRLSTPFNGAWGVALYTTGIDSVDKFGEFDLNGVSPDYFATMGTRILRGRGIERGDVAGATRVMVVGASMASVLWPGQDPIGKCLRVAEETMPCTYVVGVAEDIHSRRIGREERFYYYYLSAAQTHPDEAGLFVRAPGTPGGAQQFIEPLRKRLQQEMPGTSYVTVYRLGENIEDVTRSWVMGATLFTAFGVLALALATVGLYSVIAYSVAQRRQELAVRVALGAGAGDVLRLVVFEGLRVAGAGVAVGGVTALVAGRWIAPLLFNESARDPAVFGAVGAVLLVVAGVASSVPAMRAARVDPRAALQAE